MWLPIGCVCTLFRQNIHYFLTVRNHNSAVCATLTYSLIGDGRVGLIEGAFDGALLALRVATGAHLFCFGGAWRCHAWSCRGGGGGGVR